MARMIENSPYAKYGRNGDTEMAHVERGEMVVPAALLSAKPSLRAALIGEMAAAGIDPNEFTVGGEGMKINPETGMPEFFLGKIFKGVKNVVKGVVKNPLPALTALAVPYAAPAIGAGLGISSGLAGAGLGAGLGAVTGGGLKGALLGGATGGLSSGNGTQLANAAGLTGAGAAAGSGALTGAAAGLATGGGLKSALTGAALGGLGGYGFYEPGMTGMEGIGTGTAGNINLSAGLTPQGQAGTLAGSGLGTIGSYAPYITTGLSAIQSGMSQDEMERQLLEAQGRASGAIDPYAQIGLGAQRQLSQNLQAGFDPSGLADTQDYQFRLQQGQQALERSLAAQGLSQSGAALQAAQEYGQNFASNEYANAYNRWLQQNQQLAGVGNTGFGAAGQQANIYGNIGNIQANKTLERSNLVNQTLSQLLSGGGVPGYGYDENGNLVRMS